VIWGEEWSRQEEKIGLVAHTQDTLTQGCQNDDYSVSGVFSDFTTVVCLVLCNHELAAIGWGSVGMEVFNYGRGYDWMDTLCD
jgi:hypothetical protein